jgi:drug/metabolite transporter (DMT)-like permease
MSTRSGTAVGAGAAPAGQAAPVDLIAVMMGVGFAFVWSSAFTSAKIALVDAPPLLFLTARFLLSAVIAMGIAAALGQPLPARARQWAMLILLGLCQNSLYLGLFFIAMTTVPAGLAAIIASAMPLIVAAAAPIISSEKLGSRALLGLLLGFGGVVAIMADRLGGDLDAIGVGLCLVGVTALAGATLVVRHANLGSGLWMIVGIQMLVGAVTLAPFALAFESVEAVTVTVSLLLAFAYQVLAPGVLATLMWFALIRRIGAPRASAFHFLNPAFGVAVAWAVLAEPIGLVDVIGVAVVAIGILLVQLGARAGPD